VLKKCGGHAFAVMALLAAFLLPTVRRVSPDPYVYDEADYMYAASLGFVANYTDTPTLSVSDYVRAGMSPEKDADSRQDLSELVRHSDDVTFYRHWHGPLFQYLLTPVSRLRLDERGVRISMLAIPAASVVAIYFGCLWLVPGLGGFLAALLANTLFLSSDAVVASTELAPHELFVFWSFCFLFLLAKAVATGRRTYWYGAVFAAAIAFCALEIALVLILTLGICGYRERRQLHAGWTFAARSLTLFVATVLVLWPAAILKLSFVKAYLGLAYLALSRSSPWGGAGFLATWRGRFFASPIEWAIIFVSLVLYFRGHSKGGRVLDPVAIYALLAIAATLRVVSDTPRYSLVFMPELDLFAGLALAPCIERLRRPACIAVVSALTIGIYAAAQYRTLARRPYSNPRSAAVLLFIHQKRLDDKRLLVPQDDLPMIHYYFPATRLRGYHTFYPGHSDRSKFKADAILYRGYPVKSELTEPH
jgi:hypothetical protein